MGWSGVHLSIQCPYHFVTLRGLFCQPHTLGATERSSLQRTCDSVFTRHPLRRLEKATLERLVPLVDLVAEWRHLPIISQWVLQIIEIDYKIQFGSHPPLYNGVLLTLVHPDQVLMMEQEVKTMLVKVAIEQVPPPDREFGFYRRYFIVEKKDGGLHPISDLLHINLSDIKSNHDSNQI